MAAADYRLLTEATGQRIAAALEALSGTGAAAAAARTNLDVYSKSETDSAIAQSTANFGKRTALGNRQGAGDITLSDTIQNYRYIYIRVGYYNTGYPIFGSVFLPVDGFPVSDSSSSNFKIITEDNGTFGAATVRFTANTVLKVISITGSGSSTWYVNVTGIK